MGAVGTQTSVRRYSEGTETEIRNDFLDAVRKQLDKENERFGGQTLQIDIDSASEWLDDVFFEMNRHNTSGFITDSDEDDNSMVWKFFGKDKSTGEVVSFDFLSGYNQKSARDTLKFNGYSLTNNLLFPKNIFDYVVNNTNMNPWDIKRAQTLATVALERKRKKKR